MKLTFCLLFIVLSLTSCIQQAPPPLTDAEKAAIQTDIRKAVNSMVLGVEGLNIDSALAIFSDTPEFFMITPEGSAIDYKGFYDANKEFFSSCSRAKFTSIQDQFQFLGSDLVLYSWIYSAIIDTKAGDQFIYDKVGATFLIKKLENRWMAVYFHESSLPPTVIKGKK